ncbi:hypothetical protein [Streptomyces sp. SP18ES09]|uniref:hypothetical protein n=1 Tax=Streptomyces sp. SP18ES09 TaxID=3002532 RepID=UPI002E78D7AC|nr:hypothetical protein [Streptomyces sp. SP18ES09]
MEGGFIAGAWGLLAGGALLVGAVAGAFFRVSARVIALIMAFGSGVLISAVAFDLVAEAQAKGGIVPTVAGAVVGAVVYSGANVLLARRGARHRKRSDELVAASRQARSFFEQFHDPLGDLAWR